MQRKPYQSAAKLMARVSTISHHRGPFSVTSRVLKEKKAAVMERLTWEIRDDDSDETIVAYMTSFEREFPMNFVPLAGVKDAARAARAAAQNPKGSGDVDRETIKKMTASERLALANAQVVPFRFRKKEAGDV